MQFKFDKTAFRIEAIGIRSMSKATIAPTITFVDSNGDVKKMGIPVAISRIIRTKLNNVTRFKEPYPAYLAFVDDRIVAMDVAIGVNYKLFCETGDWFSVLESREELIEKISDEWLWDGQYAYKHIGAVQRLGTTNFGHISVRAFNLYKMGDEQAEVIENLASLCYFNVETEEWVITSPLTRNSGGFIQMTGDVEQFNKSDQFIDSDSQLDQMDLHVFPNLRFVNYAARALVNQFGYESIEPLGLPLLIIEHRNFNLSGLPLPIQASSPAPLKFTQALAWLIGLYTKIQTLEDLIAIKTSAKMLLSKGSTNHRVMGEQQEETNTKELIKKLRDGYEKQPLISFGELFETTA